MVQQHRMSPQRHQPPQGPQPLPPGTRAPQPIMQPSGTGTIEGFVYWDTGTFTHTPASSCTGLSLTVSVRLPVALARPLLTVMNAEWVPAEVNVLCSVTCNWPSPPL